MWKNGSMYVGEFRAGMRDGRGTFRFNGDEGDIYDGEYRNDEKHGFGVYRWKNKVIYEGFFHKGRKNGKGKMTYANGKCSYTLWENGKSVLRSNENEFIQAVKRHQNLQNRSNYSAKVSLKN